MRSFLPILGLLLGAGLLALAWGGTAPALTLFLGGFCWTSAFDALGWGLWIQGTDAPRRQQILYRVLRVPLDKIPTFGLGWLVAGWWGVVPLAVAQVFFAHDSAYHLWLGRMPPAGDHEKHKGWWHVGDTLHHLMGWPFSHTTYRLYGLFGFVLGLCLALLA